MHSTNYVTDILKLNVKAVIKMQLLDNCQDIKMKKLYYTRIKININ